MLALWNKPAIGLKRLAKNIFAGINTSQQNWNASEYANHASFVPAMASDVMGLSERQIR
jgi:hypothetical protein